MAIAPGTRLGAYEIVSLLGAGGMGELFFVSGEPRTLMSIAVDSTGSTFKWGVPATLFPAPYSGFEGGVGPRNYDLSPDGRRFLTLKDVRANSEATQLVVIENWFEELKQRVPKGN